jgi:hypothetical protein
LKKISKPSKHADSRGLADRPLTLPQRKRGRQRNKPPVIKHSENPTPEQDNWWATVLILEPEDKIQTLTATPQEGGAAKKLSLKDRRKKHYPTTWQDYNRVSA